LPVIHGGHVADAPFPIASASNVRDRRISRTMTGATSLPLPNSAYITAPGESRTDPMPSEISASRPTRATNAVVVPVCARHPHWSRPLSQQSSIVLSGFICPGTVIIGNMRQK
jgi:hypothetical protein